MTLQQDIESTRTSILIADVLMFFIVSGIWFYAYLLEIEFSLLFIGLFLMAFVLLFIITAMAMAELTSRARKTFGQCNNQRGWVLIDSLIAIVIVAVAICAIALGYRHSTITTASARDYNQAVFIAQQTLENLKLQEGQASFVSLPQDLTPEKRNNITYNIKIERATNLTETLNDKIIPVKATVSWNVQNQPKHLEVVSYYYTN